MADGGGLLELAAAAGAGGNEHVVALVHARQNVGDALAHAFRRDAVGDIVGALFLAPAIGLGHGALHRAGDGIGIEDDAAVDVARGAADGLHQARFAAQEALLVGIEDGDKRDLRQIEALAQQVDADEHVVLAEAQVADDLDPLERVDLRVQVAGAEAELEQIG